MSKKPLIETEECIFGLDCGSKLFASRIEDDGTPVAWGYGKSIGDSEIKCLDMYYYQTDSAGSAEGAMLHIAEMIKIKSDAAQDPRILPIEAVELAEEISQLADVLHKNMVGLFKNKGD